MQDLFDFLGRCRSEFRRLVVRQPRQEFASKRRKLVDHIVVDFINGFNAAADLDVDTLNKQLNGLPYPANSVCAEGAYCAVALQDIAHGNDFEKLKQVFLGHGAQPVSINEGIGHALALGKMSTAPCPEVFESFWGWFAMDGYGMHDGYFRWTEGIEKQREPAWVTGIGKAAYDQGIGRAIWLASAAEPHLIRDMVEKFPHRRRADLWSGIGMMSGVWGLCDEKDMKHLLNKAGRWRPYLQSGTAIGVHARVMFNAIEDHTEAASEFICRAGMTDVQTVVGTALAELGKEPTTSSEFLAWKAGVTQVFARS